MLKQFNNAAMSISFRGHVFDSTANPNVTRHAYSPLKDTIFFEWNARVGSTTITSWKELLEHLQKDEITGPRGAVFGSSGVLFNSPCFSEDGIEHANAIRLERAKQLLLLT